MYLPIHVHSYYSFLQSTLSVERIVQKYKELGARFVPLTDTNGMYGFVKLAREAESLGLKPIYGAYIDDPTNKEKYILIYAKNMIGFSELCLLISKRHLEENFQLDEIVKSISENIIIVTPSLELLKQLPPGDNIYAELKPDKNQKYNTKQLYQYAKSSGYKYVASSPIHFEQHDDYLFLKILLSIKYRTNVDKLKTDERIDEEFFFKDEKLWNRIWKNLPEAVSAIDEIVDACNVELKLCDYKFPKFETPNGETSIDYLKQLAWERLNQLYQEITPPLIKQFEYELEVISELNFQDYFLIVWDIVEEAKRRDMVYIGRGSAGNSLISYCLGFTSVDPIKYDMYFERFMNKFRKDPPDIDLDFSWKERDEIIRYVFEKYGYSKVAMISTHVTFRGRSAFRETAKALGFSEMEIEKYSKMIPWVNPAALPNIVGLKEKFPESQELPFDEEPWKRVVDYASKLTGFPRHLSIHPSGILVAPDRITNFTALEFANNKGLGLIVTQPDMYGVSDLGLVKIDLLSQRSLGVLRDTIKQIEKNENK
ncbi:MAG: DNA polymerase III subunit alpha [Ignavibacteriaceae bacterium]|nr:DNA polymerase III subunit alpha [Ignavibacteriaceae bacterium]